MAGERIDVLAVILEAQVLAEHYDEACLPRDLEEARAAVAELIEATKNALAYVATVAVGCHGDKCREPWCYSCWGEDEADSAAERARDAYNKAHAALSRIGATP